MTSQYVQYLPYFDISFVVIAFDSNAIYRNWKQTQNKYKQFLIVILFKSKMLKVARRIL